ncbi:phosphopantothenoylcysteine decarboxylase isoform X4 [Ictidomys tridecemlineatus]
MPVFCRQKLTCEKWGKPRDYKRTQVSQCAGSTHRNHVVREEETHSPEIFQQLEVTVVTTERAKHFYNPQDIPVTLYSDSDEWEMWKHRSDPVLHIDLRRWADLMLVAPLDANTLGKVASGICDNLLVDQLKAFGYVEIPCVDKKLVCGDQGLGAMAEVETIVDKVKEVLSQHSGVQQS